MAKTPPRNGKPAAKKASAKKPERTKKTGTPKGKGTIRPAHGGQIGNPPFKITEQQRLDVRGYAKTFPVHAEHHIATLIGVSLSTLKKHFQPDLDLGRAQMLAGVGAQMINRAMDANAASAKGDIEAQKFILARLGGWTTKVDMSMSGPGGKPLEVVDLSRLSEEQLFEYGRLAAIAEGLDPEEVFGNDAED